MFKRKITPDYALMMAEFAVIIALMALFQNEHDRLVQLVLMVAILVTFASALTVGIRVIREDYQQRTGTPMPIGKPFTLRTIGVVVAAAIILLIAWAAGVFR